jgi:AraC-like DNA-binding protein
MLIFAYILFIPFSFISYGIAQKNIGNSITFSNNIVLSQINYGYGYMSDMIANICLEVYLNNYTQQFLYSQDFVYKDIITYMRNLTETTVTTNPSIDSIVLYNAKNDEWISTKNTDPPPGRELRDFINTQQSVPRLRPILRQITRYQGNFEIQSYIFSYFMYEFSDPVNGNDSFITVNQDASWFIDNLTSIRQTGNYVDSVYLVTDSGIIYSNSVDTHREAEGFLIDDFIKHHIQTEDGTYQQRYGNKRYLLSFIRLGGQKNHLIILRNYEDVFRDLINLQRDYLLFGCVFLGVIILLLIPFSRRIYSPVRAFVALVSQADSSSPDQFSGVLNPSVNIENEFEYLRNIYRNTDELNKKLRLQSASYEPVFEQYQLFSLVNNDTEENYERFKKVLPDHWLAKNNIGSLWVLLFKIDHFEENRYKFEKNDRLLLVSSIRNIIYNSLVPGCEFAIFLEEPDSLGVFVRTERVEPVRNGENEVLLSAVNTCQDSVKQNFNVTVSISLSGATEDVLSLGELYREAKEYLRYRFVFGEGAVINRKRCRLNIENQELRYPVDLDEKLMVSVREKNISRGMIALEDIKNALLGFQYTNIIICMMELVNNLVRIISQMEPEASGIRESEHLYKNVINAEFMDDFFQELRYHISAVLGGTEPEAETRNTRNISPILYFIQNNYSNPNLSSHMIGEYLGMSNRYVMYKFMESTGKSLNDYIIEVRMHKAANLLRNTNLPVSKIAAQIGMGNGNYFYRLFKKVYNYTPREFSKKFREGPLSGSLQPDSLD